MKATAIAQFPAMKRNHTLFLVGGEPTLLSGDYHPDQLWFEFMSGSIFEASAPLAAREHVRLRQDKLNRKQFARLGPPHTYLYEYEEGVEQYPLRFEEGKRISNSRWKALCDADWPTWHKEQGRPISIYVQNLTYDPASWCKENLDGFFHCASGVITCELEIDVIRVKLVFG